MEQLDYLDFWKKYQLIESTKTFKATLISPRICRFCKRGERETTFKTTTHAIPELLGNNNFISFDECDKCNAKFSGLESHLSKFFMPYLTMAGVKGKRGIPAFHSRTEKSNEQTRTIIKSDGQGKRNIILTHLDDYKIDEVSKTMQITFRLPPHKPFHVYKSLVKIAMSLLPAKDVVKYKNSFKWLIDEPSHTDIFYTAFITLLTSGRFAEPFAELYSAKRVLSKDKFYPKLTLVVGFGNIVIQIFPPLPDKMNSSNLQGRIPELNLFPSIFFEKDKNKSSYTIRHIDLKSKVSVTNDEIISFTYESADLNIGK